MDDQRQIIGSALRGVTRETALHWLIIRTLFPFGMLIRWVSPLSLFIFVTAVAEQLPIKVYTSADGLPSDHVNQIVVDSHGYVWIATTEGLARFDGYQFTTYRVDQGLPSLDVNNMIQLELVSPSHAYKPP